MAHLPCTDIWEDDLVFPQSPVGIFTATAPFRIAFPRGQSLLGNSPCVILPKYTDDLAAVAGAYREPPPVSRAQQEVNRIRRINMFYRSLSSVAVLWCVTSCFLFGQQRSEAHPQRDAQAIEILTRVVQASGGPQALASVHDIAESGEITFYWGKDVKGPVTIKALGGNHFRMEADLSPGKNTWIVEDGVGSKKEKDSGKFIPISRENALNFGNLT
jgi:hypothetical protein